ncbi:hypothetical protein HYU92_02560 [Candidatus Curtissbacteria bacterium]|nr:hypothetical protein [Candidatus Curtissbacteria bacterium]
MPKIVEIPKIDPKVKEVLILLGAGTFLVGSIIFPGLPLAAKPLIDAKRESELQKRQKEWEKFNLWRLRQVIKRMQQAKLVEIKEENGNPLIKITEKGKRKLLRYKIEEMELDESKWDGKWRLVIYDIVKSKKANSELFRISIKKLNLLKLQKSVYLTPFKCEDEIEYLRQLFAIGNEVQILTVGSLENETAYRKYFGI